MDIRVGNGFDLHRFKDGRKLFLAGVEIDAKRGLDGVSDADLVLHSIADSILGALAKGDIGDFYPPEDPKSQGLDSKEIIDGVLAFMDKAGYRISNIDITIILEEVRLKKYKAAISESLSKLLNLDKTRLCFKIKSQEKMIEYEKACAICFATVLLIAD